MQQQVDLNQVDLSKKPLLILEGNIGAGKSTFLKLLKESLDVDIIFEPTDKWQNVGEDGNLLDLFYKDTKRWAYTFQSYAFITRVESVLKYQQENKNNKIQILERSVYCDRYCFAKNCFESDLMSTLEWKIYKEWFSWLVENYMQRPNGFIYLKVSPEVCEQRLRKRDRSEESGVGIDYLRQLHQKHEDWLINKKGVSTYLSQVPVLILNCDRDFENDIVNRNNHVKLVQDFINSLTIVPQMVKPVQHQI